MKKNVLLTGGRSPFTLDLTRLFAHSGYNIYIAESITTNLSSASKYVKKTFKVMSPAFQTEEFIYDLIKIIKENNIHILIPTCEEVFYVSKGIDKLSKYCDVFTENRNVLKTLHSKFLFIDLLKKLNINHPKTKVFESILNLKSEVKLNNSFVLKPEFSRFAAKVFINDTKGFDKIKISSDYRWVFQEYIKGKVFCSYSVVRNGEIRAHSAYPVNYSIDNGASLYFEYVDIPEIKEIVSKICQELNYTGQIAFDFIFSEKDGLYYPIECNPRSTSGICLFDKSDNLPYAFDLDKNELIYCQAKYKKMMFAGMLFYSFPYIRDKSAFSKITSDIKLAKDVMFDINDLKPFFIQIMIIYIFLKLAIKNRVSLTEAATIDIEWNGN